MAVVKAVVRIVGTRPLLWNRFGVDSLPLDKKARSGVAGNDPQEWKKTYLATKNRQLYIEPSYIFGSLRNAARYTRRGNSSLQWTVASTLQVMDEKILINRSLPKRGLEDLREESNALVYLDVRSVKNPKTRARNVRYRVATAKGWQTEFTIAWDNTLISDDQMRAVVRDAGQFVGVGDARNIGYGRFDVASFAMVEEHNAQKSSSKRTLANSAR